MKQHRTGRLVALFCLALSLATVPLLTSSGQERAMPGDVPRCGEIHDAISARGIPVTSVRCRNGQYEIVPAPNCSAGQLAEAQRIMTELLSAPPAVIVVDNLQDAVAVIQFEPNNESARRLLKQRYEELKAAARKAGQ